jgi:hypothetical protein
MDFGSDAETKFYVVLLRLASHCLALSFILLVNACDTLFCNEVSVNLNIFCPIMPMCLVVMQAGLQMLYRVPKSKTMSKQAARTALPPFPP